MPLETEETPAETTRVDLPTATTPQVDDSATGVSVTADSVTADSVTADDVTADDATADDVTAEPVAAEPVSPEPVAAEPVTEDHVTAEPVTDGLLLPDADNLHGNWLRVQSAFVDDPRASVSEAADLVEHAAQALAGALQQRQRALREQWDGDGGTNGGTNGDPAADTERLRRTLQQYRAVFNQICGV